MPGLYDWKYANRQEAGRNLSASLASFAGRIDTMILALPRGGVPVAGEVAKALSLPFDIWLVRKLGVPGHEEMAFGAIATGDTIVFNEDILARFPLGEDRIRRIIDQEKQELHRRHKAYRGGHPAPDVAGKAIIIVDDGFATGATIQAAIASLRQAGALWIAAAAPVGAPSVYAVLATEADEVICPFQPEPFYSVGQWYENFVQVSDADVIAALQRRDLPTMKRPVKNLSFSKNETRLKRGSI